MGGDANNTAGTSNVVVQVRDTGRVPGRLGLEPQSVHVRRARHVRGAVTTGALGVMTFRDGAHVVASSPSTTAMPASSSPPSRSAATR